MPVVVRTHRGERELIGVGPHREPLTDEPRKEGRKTERRPHAVDIHIGHACVDIPRAASHLVEACRFEAVLSRRSADHRVETDIGKLLTLPHPRLAAVAGVDDARLVAGETLREPSDKRVGRLHDVIVDGDHRIDTFTRHRLRQPRDVFPPTVAASECSVAREVVKRHVHSITSGSFAKSRRVAPSQNAHGVFCRSTVFRSGR